MHDTLADPTQARAELRRVEARLADLPPSHDAASPGAAQARRIALATYAQQLRAVISTGAVDNPETLGITGGRNVSNVDTTARDTTPACTS